MKIIDGVIFGSVVSTTAAFTDEIAEMLTHVDLLALAGGRARVFQVSGDGASPVALNGQYLGDCRRSGWRIMAQASVSCSSERSSVHAISDAARCELLERVVRATDETGTPELKWPGLTVQR
jgi:hypothetical protein